MMVCRIKWCGYCCCIQCIELSRSNSETVAILYSGDRTDVYSSPAIYRAIVQLYMKFEHTKLEYKGAIYL